MEEPLRTDSLAKAIRALAVTVGFLAAGVLALFALYAFWLFQSRTYFRGTSSISTSTSRTTRPAAAATAGAPADEKSFHSLSVEEKIQHSSAILMTKHEKEGKRIKAVVSEILKRPDAGLNFTVGDELADVSTTAEEGTDYGDGDVVFLVGAGADMRESMTYRGGRISGLGEMPLDVFRALVRGGTTPVTAPSSGAGSAATSSPAGEVPQISLERTTNGQGVTRSFSIPRSAALGIPEWFPEKGEPPLKMTKAIQLATDAASASSPDHATFVARAIRLQLVSCDEPIGNRWYYVLDCVPRQTGGLGMMESVPVVVLMDGTVVPGKIQR
jgi:hypothetical protein